MEIVTLADLSVMLVEPSPVQATLIRRQLVKVGLIRVKLVRSGEEALQTMMAEMPDLVISAFYLADMTGADLINTMRANEDLEHVGFMLISSETNFGHLDPVRQAGPVAILPKPFETDSLRSALHAAVDQVNAREEGQDHSVFDELRVLVVDDTSVARKFMCRILKMLGIEDITEAEDGVQAASLMNDMSFDVVVTDLNMPRMDGLEFVEFIREESHQSTVPVIMVTSDEDEARLEKVRHAGVDAICGKPFDMTKMGSLIEELLLG